MLSVSSIVLLILIVNNDQHKVFGNMFDLVSSHDQSRDFCDFHTDQENVIGQLNQNLNINEKLELKTQSMDITLEKVSSNNLTGKHLTQPIGTEIRFPELNLNQTITINLITVPSASIVSLTLHDEFGDEINIQNTTEPFEILIPRQSPILMPSMTRQNVRTFKTTNLPFKYYHVNLTHQQNHGISLHIEFLPEHANLSYLFVIRFDDKPDLKNEIFDDKQLVCSQGKKYTYFLDNQQISHHQSAIFGIRELKQCQEDDLDTPVRFTSDYSLRMYTSGCYYLDNKNHWQSDGLLIGSKTNEHLTQCYSTHLTTFAGGFIVLPDPLDINADDLNFNNMKTIYITLIVLAILYGVTMAYSYYKDKRDAQMLMVIPMMDNNARDKYLYQLVVFTGMRANAGTKSKVHLILSGDDDETNVRSLVAERPIFQRGSTDSFIMAVPRPLGQLNYLRIWHDNSGFDSEASWYLKYILVRDLQTMETSYFICEKWFAVEKDDGLIERTVPIAGELQKRELKHLLSKNAYRSMADNHLWFSIFAYHIPSANRFTRIQRCTCCFVILFMSLLMNLMFYKQKQNLEGDELNQNGLIIGPFCIAKEQISMSIFSELVIFLPSLILVALFRRSKARQPRKISPVGEAIQAVRAQQSESKVDSSKSERFLLPWWCLILAYVLSFLIVATAIAFIIVRCAQYGDDEIQKWLGSILINFCTSVLFTQPLKVLSLAVLFMCVCRKKSQVQVEAFIEEEDPIKDFTVSREDPHKKYPPKSILAKTRLDPYRAKRERKALKQLHDIRLKEVKAWFILRELFFLLLFLGVLYAISFANRDIHNAHHMVRYLRHEFLEVDYIYEYKYRVREKKNTFVFDNIKSFDDYWHWLNEVFTPRYLQIISPSTNNYARRKVDNRTIVPIGYPALRQLRVKNDSCPRKVLRNQIDIDDCNLPYTWYNEAKTPFGANLNTSAATKYNAPFSYTSNDDQSLIHSTKHATYMSGGYVHTILGPSQHLIQSGFNYLRKHGWIDRYTRAVFLTFGLYSADSNLFVYCSLVVEQLPTTYELVVRASFQPLRLVHLYTGSDLIYCLIYIIMIFYYMYVEVKTMFELRRKYIKHFWSYMNWAIVFCSWFGIVIHVLRENEIRKMSNGLKTASRNIDRNVSLQFFSYLDSVLTYLLGFCCFFGTIKILRLLRFNRRMSLLHLTLAKSARQLVGFFVMSSFVFLAFVSLFYLLFHTQIQQYATWSETASTCFQMVTLDFSTIEDLKKISPFIAGLCLFLFVFLAVFLLSSMFVSIIVDNFNSIRQEQLKQPNEVEMIRFIRTKIRQWMGKRTHDQTLDKMKNPVAAFPEKIDELMMTLDKINRNTNH